MRAVVLLLITALAGGSAWPADYLDTSFGDNGVVTFPGHRSAKPALQLADGSLIVINEATDVLETVSVTKLDRNGSFVASFGQNGNVLADPTSPYTSVSAVFDGGNGRVVLTGWLYPLSRPYLKRLNRDGRPDASFGNADALLYRDGRAQPSLGNPGVLDFGYTAPKIGPPTTSCYSDAVIAYHPTADGGAFAVVHRGLQDCFGFPVSVETYLVRIQPSGALDESYGRASFNRGLGSYGSRLLPDGRLELWTRAGKQLVAADGRSVAVTSGAPANFPTTLIPRNTYFQPDGSWIVLPEFPAPPSFEVHRPDGQPEALFGNAGHPIETGSAGSYLLQVFRTPDGGVAGILSANTLESQRLCVWRANGRIESCSSLPDWRDSVLERGLMAPDGALYLSWEGTGSPPRLARFYVAAPNVEYFNSQLRHYFVTYDGTEARSIDEGGAGPGWSRTGQGFKTGGTTPVCRFYGTPGIGSNSHFFTIDAQECELVKKDPGWSFEGYGFYATPAVNGQCGSPLAPVHRLYNNRAAQRDSNHRHVTDLSLIPPMVLAGWSYEGVAFCVKP